MSPQPVPEQIRRVFGVPEGDFVPEPGTAARWRVGDVVCSRVADATVATLSARAREKLTLDGVGVARAMRGTDGRYVVGGWRADRYARGELLSRPDEIIALGDYLGRALAGVILPRRRSGDALWRPAAVFDHAMEAAWSGEPSRDLDSGLQYHMEQGGERFEGHRAEALIAATGMARLRDSIDDAGRAEPARRASPSRAVDAPVAHIDLAHSLRFTEDGPLLVDVVTAPADPIRGQAIAAVDLLSAKAAGEDLLWRWALIPGWSKNVVCAMAYRLSVHALHPDSSQSAFAGLRSATEIVDRFARSAHNL